MQKVTGIGGVFIKVKDTKAMAAWYAHHLGIDFGENLYVNFEWSTPGSTVFSLFKEDTKYFDPGNQSFMLNFRVKNLLALFELLKSENVQVIGEVEEYEYGKFGRIMDPEGNKIELWEPADEKPLV